MSDTWIEDSICQAIQIITDRKIEQASFDKTIRATIVKVVDKSIGKYLVRYNDSKFEAFAASSDVTYNKDQVVFVLVPGNDMTRPKTIISGTANTANNFSNIPIVDQKYNTIGPNVITSGSPIGIQSAYYPSEKIDVSNYLHIVQLYNIHNSASSNYVIVDQQKAKTYIARSKADGIILSMTVRTQLQKMTKAGRYGVVFNLKYYDTLNENATKINSYVVDSSDVIGQPYLLSSPTIVKHFENSETAKNQDFIEVDSIYAFCQGFGLQGPNAPVDIFISQVGLGGAISLTEDQLSRYTLHIDYSSTGNIIEDNIKQVVLSAQLKIKGQNIDTSKVHYYWFRENGMVFQGHAGYHRSGGDGWQCLNLKGDKDFEYAAADIIFTRQAQPPVQSSPIIRTARDNVTKVKCAALYDNVWFTGETTVYNNNIINDLWINSSDLNSLGQPLTKYYQNRGNPTLFCLKGEAENPDTNWTYTWTQFTQENRKREDLKPVISQTYTVPIKDITGYNKIICTVEDNQGTYIGTASIILYNSMQIERDYTLIINNGSQTFQYDSRGNSPASPQKQDPLKIQPLSFTLTNKDGIQITYEQILAKKGNVYWVVPKEQYSMIIPGSTQVQPVGGNTVPWFIKQQNLALSADSYLIFHNVKELPFKIADVYSETKDQNDIRLHIDYNTLSFDAFTNFAIPKNGDPGTNGTTYMAKIGVNRTGQDVSNVDSDRLYVYNLDDELFDETGNSIDSIKFLLYNNSKEIPVADNKIYWPSFSESKSIIFNNNNKTIKFDLSKLNLTDDQIKQSLNVNNPSSNKVYEFFKDKINIIRASTKVAVNREQDTNPDMLTIYAEYPICSNVIWRSHITDDYQIVVAPKTGFKYVVYSQSGYRPDYRNDLPFEIKLLKQKTPVDVNKCVFSWVTIGNLNKGTVKKNTCQIIPKDKFDGDDLTAAVFCRVQYNWTEEKENNTTETHSMVGYIHIPVYLSLNRYGHQALNDWDGNGIQFKEDEKNSIILTPQIGAGKKNEDNTFTGMFMGVKKTGSDEQIGLMAYDEGARTIFLDAQTGKAEFGKNNQGQIAVDPSLKIRRKENLEYKPAALLYSGNYPLKKKRDYITKEITLDVATWPKNDPNIEEAAKQGMLIDLSTPQIGFGNGKFYVTSEGQMHSQSGEIGGWVIGENNIHSKNEEVYLYSKAAENTSSYPYTIYTNSGKFSVTPEGELHSEDGDIAGWDINKKTLSKNNVGMNSDPTNGDYAVTEHQAKAFFANGNNFYVTHDGYLKSQSGNIARWNVTASSLESPEDTSGRKIVINSNGSIDANYEAGQSGWKIQRNGNAYFNGGNIAGWDFNKSTLSAKNITIDSSGEIRGNYEAGNTGWMINSDGKAYFKELYANKSGKIAGWDISSEGLSSNKIKITANGAIQQTEGGWSINQDGTATFNNITANNKGNIGGWKIDGNTLSSSSGNNSLILNGSTGSIQGNYGTDKGWSINRDGSVDFNQGTIGGFHIEEKRLWAGGSAISPSLQILDTGQMHGGQTNGYDWWIKPNGTVEFQDVMFKVGSSSSSGGGSSGSGGGGGFSYNPSTGFTSMGGPGNPVSVTPSDDGDSFIVNIGNKLATIEKKKDQYQKVSLGRQSNELFSLNRAANASVQQQFQEQVLIGGGKLEVTKPFNGAVKTKIKDSVTIAYGEDEEKSLYDYTTLRVGQLTADKATIEELHAVEGKIDNLDVMEKLAVQGQDVGWHTINIPTDISLQLKFVRNSDGAVIGLSGTGSYISISGYAISGLLLNDMSQGSPWGTGLVNVTEG